MASTVAGSSVHQIGSKRHNNNALTDTPGTKKLCVDLTTEDDTQLPARATAVSPALANSHILRQRGYVTATAVPSALVNSHILRRRKYVPASASPIPPTSPSSTLSPPTSGPPVAFVFTVNQSEPNRHSKNELTGGPVTETCVDLTEEEDIPCSVQATAVSCAPVNGRKKSHVRFTVGVEIPAYRQQRPELMLVEDTQENRGNRALMRGDTPAYYSQSPNYAPTEPLTQPPALSSHAPNSPPLYPPTSPGEEVEEDELHTCPSCGEFRHCYSVNLLRFGDSDNHLSSDMKYRVKYFACQPTNETTDTGSDSEGFDH